jgi:hypothetical protein
MATPDTRNSIVIKKQGGYRAGDKVWSNRYHFEGDLPATPAAWETLADAIVAQEKTVFHSEQTIIQAIGYDKASATSTNPHGDAVFAKDYTTAGTFTPATGDVGAPGDCASLVRYATPARSTKNHPVYLMNYYHGVFNRSASADTLSPTQKTALEAYADHWISGFSDGTENHERCGPRGAVATGRRVDPYVRHRDFPT